MVRRSLPKGILYSMVPMFAVLITWVTGFLAGFQFEQGLPLPWKTGWGCPGPSLGVLCTVISYNWLAFGLDVLFYTAVGYGSIFVYTRYHATNQPVCRRNAASEA